MTKTFLPPKEFHKLLDEIWESNQIANGGFLHQKQTEELNSYLKVENIILAANGALPSRIP